MARTRATLHTSIWNPDSDFRFRTASAQRLYFLILTQGDLSLCGVAALTVDRWSRLASDTKPIAIRKALAELVEHHYIVVDELTQEVWIRTFTTHDGVLRQPNMVVSMSKDFDAIQSEPIREGFVEGLPDGLLEGLPDGYRARLAGPFLAWVLRTRARAPSPSPTPSPTYATLPSPPNIELKSFEVDFDECWEIYPRKESRKAALEKYIAQRRRGVSKDLLFKATGLFADKMAREARDKDKIMLGQTFFGPHDRWEDFTEAPPPVYDDIPAPPPHSAFDVSEYETLEVVKLPGEE